MSGPRTKTCDELRAEAADKIVRAYISGVAPEVDAGLIAWRSADIAHESAFLEASGTWEAARDLQRHPRYVDLKGAPTLRERWVAWSGQAGESLAAVSRPPSLALAGACLVLLACLGVALSGHLIRSDYQTQIAQVRDLALDDGSHVILGARSALDVEYRPQERRVRLASGEAFFSVAPNRARPFVVLAGETRIRVVGTKFNVNYQDGRVRVTVLDGVVEVMRADGSVRRIGQSGSSDVLRLTASQQGIDAPGLPHPKLEATGIEDAGSWREGRLSYRDAPLSEIVADANRYRTGEIRIASPNLAREPLTTSFKSSQIDDMLDQLPAMLPVQVQRNPDGTVDLRAR